MQLPFLPSKNLKAFPKAFSTKVKLSTCPANKQTKKSHEARKAKELEKAKGESRDRCITFTPKTENFAFCADAQTLEADIWHLKQRAAKCTTCRWIFVSFNSLQPNSNQKTTQLASKCVFLQNSQGPVG